MTSFIPGVLPDGTVSSELQGTEGQGLLFDASGKLIPSNISGGVGGVTDHGALTGLSDDDHAQYHNDARANAWLATKSTSDLAEGTNQYHTTSRARTAAVVNSLAGTQTDQAPSVAAVDAELDAIAAALANKSNVGHAHLIADVVNLQSTLDGKAAAVHAHAITDVTGLQVALDGKQPLDSDLTAIAALAPSNDDVLQRKAGAWTNRTIAQLLTDLGAVVGPASATNLAVAIYDLTTGKLLKNSLVTIDASGNIIVPIGTYIGVTSVRCILFGAAGNIDVKAPASIRMYADNGASGFETGTNEGVFNYIGVSGILQLPQQAGDPATPTSNRVRVYCATKRLRVKDSDGNVVQLDEFVAKRDAVAAWTKPQRYTAQTLTDAATIAFNVANGPDANLTLTANGHTFGNPTNVNEDDRGMIHITPAGFTLTGWDSEWDFGSAGAPTLSGIALCIVSWVRKGSKMRAVSFTTTTA